MKTSIIPIADLYLIALLNSKTIDLYLKNIASTKQNGYYEYKPVYVSQLPIVVNEGNYKEGIERIAKLILECRKVNLEKSTELLEKDIDQLVYHLYEISEEEIMIIEGELS